jgi:hypothetical protein
MNTLYWTNYLVTCTKGPIRELGNLPQYAPRPVPVRKALSPDTPVAGRTLCPLAVPPDAYIYHEKALCHIRAVEPYGRYIHSVEAMSLRHATCNLHY